MLLNLRIWGNGTKKDRRYEYKSTRKLSNKPDQIIDEKDSLKRTALYLASKYNHLDVVKTLLDE